MRTIFCVVKYGNNVSFDRIQVTVKRAFPCSDVFVLNNLYTNKHESEILGSNRQHEFSGYLELLELVTADGTIVLMNDTFFDQHFTSGWVMLLKKLLNKMSTDLPILYGDMRNDGTDLLERPDPFFASWLFVFSNRDVTNAFIKSLKSVLKNESPIWSEAYETFLQNWLFAKSWRRGWHGKIQKGGSILMKKKCIYWEHQLSAKLLETKEIESQSLGKFNPLLYQIIRLADRISTAFRRII